MNLKQTMESEPLAPVQTVVVEQKEALKIKPMGKWMIYTAESYYRAKNRTFEQDGLIASPQKVKQP